MREIETGFGLSLHDYLKGKFASPYVFVPYDIIQKESGATKKQIANTLSRLRKEINVDIKSVLHIGGWSLVPKGADTKFDLTNFRDPHRKITRLPRLQREAVENIWPHINKVEQIEYTWNDQAVSVLNPLFPEWVFNAFSTAITILADEDRGLVWQDIYPAETSEKYGKTYLSTTVFALNKFCESNSIPFRLVSPNRITEYRFVKK